VTALYRSPNVIIDAHEWHVLVKHTGKRVCTYYRWRPVSEKPLMWQPMVAWEGPKPKNFQRYLKKFHPHIRAARENAITPVKERAQMNAAAVRNKSIARQKPPPLAYPELRIEHLPDGGAVFHCSGVVAADLTLCGITLPDETATRANRVDCPSCLAIVTFCRNMTARALPPGKMRNARRY
jgi:hypothetical protein